MVEFTADGLHDWTFETLIPQWVARTFNRNSTGYIEFFTPDGVALPQSSCGALTTARLVYTYSSAHRLHPAKESLQAAQYGFSLLQNVQTKNGFIPRQFHADYSAVTPVCDLYDQAFVLFACAAYFATTKDPAALKLADTVFAYISDHLTHPAGGYMEDNFNSQPRRQNPHMHLLEAVQELALVTGTQCWIQRSVMLTDLMTRNFLDAKGFLAEYFTDDWKIAPGKAGEIREPGHQFEWVWLLHRQQTIARHDRAAQVAEGLFIAGTRDGLEQRSNLAPLALDAVTNGGTVIEATKLLWPQTEAVKAFGARAELLQNTADLQHMLEHLRLIFRYYIDEKTGLWHNQLSENQQPLTVNLPARVLYHLFLCLTETIRILRLFRINA